MRLERGTFSDGDGSIQSDGFAKRSLHAPLICEEDDSSGSAERGGGGRCAKRSDM